MLGVYTGFHLANKTRKQMNFSCEEIFHKDKHTCQFCGVYTLCFLEVYQTEAKNPIFQSACPYCFQALSGNIGDKEFGRIIYAPELSQTELNWTVHTITASLSVGGGLAIQAQNLLNELDDRHELVNEIWGDGMALPSVITSVFSKLPRKTYDERNRIFYGLRFLPDLKKFDKEISYWKGTLYEKMNKKYFDKMLERWDKPK